MPLYTSISSSCSQIWHPLYIFHSIIILSTEMDFFLLLSSSTLDGGLGSNQTLQRPKSHVSVKTKEKELPKTGFRKKWYTFTKYVENYQRQIFWVTLYVLVSIGIFVERAHCKYI